MARKPKPPKIPRCLCGGFIHWLLQIPSPSRFYQALLRPTVESEKYFQAYHQYEITEILRKVEMRTCTRKEWDRLRRERHRERIGYPFGR